MNNKIRKICHLADIHIQKSPLRHEEYKYVFKNLYKSLIKEKPDRIVIVGDLVDDYIDLQGEQLKLVKDFLFELAKIAPVRITRGNHDFLQKNKKRKDAIESVLDVIECENIIYYNQTGFFEDENVTWAVWHHGDKKSPWDIDDADYKLENTIIDLFHDPVNGAISSTNYELNSKAYRKISDFKGNYLFAGDIHNLQFLDKGKTKAYSSSLIAQNFGEGDDKFHGYLLWDIENKKVKEISINNNHSFKSIEVNTFTDFDELDIEIDNPTKFMSIRVIWRTLPYACNMENEKKVRDYLNAKYSPLKIKNKQEFLEENKIDVENDINIDNIVTQTVQHEIIEKYLNKIGVDEDIIDEVLKLDDMITSRINVEDFTNIEWDIVKFWGKNFMSYEDILIDWRDQDGVFQITGENAAGKTTLFKLILYVLHNKTPETDFRLKYGDSRFINNKLDVNYCEGGIVINANNEFYGIYRKTEVDKNGQGEITKCSTIVNYYLLNNPDDSFDDDKNINNLAKERKIKTQKVIEKVIGTYENFLRVVFTTSDTLNNILSNQKADFIDALLFDSGLDIFDQKLTTFKKYIKDEKSLEEKIKLDEEQVSVDIKAFQNEIEVNNNKIIDLELKQLPHIKKRIDKGEKYKENLIINLNKIDEKISSLNIETINSEIDKNNDTIKYSNIKKNKLSSEISTMKDTYNEAELEKLMLKKEKIIQEIYGFRTEIKNIENNINSENHKIERINGEIYLIKKRGGEYKNEYDKILKSKNCPTCGQIIDKEEHKAHIEKSLKTIKTEMILLANDIKIKESEIPPLKLIINDFKNEIDKINEEITNKTLDSEKLLMEIGILINDKNEVEKRKDIVNEIHHIISDIENLNLKNEIHKKNIDLYNNFLKQIEENKVINKKIEEAKNILESLKYEEEDIKDQIYGSKSKIAELENKILDFTNKLTKYKEQVRIEQIHDLYKDCIHRDGIPTQILVNNIIPKINRELSSLLENVKFKIWLDLNDLRLKLSYVDTYNAVIDVISSSGMERTFSSVCLKFVLNRINTKSKPKIFLLDEITGKLTVNSFKEFNEILSAIKDKMKRILIVEHVHDVNMDHLIKVEIDENYISHLTIE